MNMSECGITVVTIGLLGMSLVLLHRRTNVAVKYCVIAFVVFSCVWMILVGLSIWPRVRLHHAITTNDAETVEQVLKDNPSAVNEKGFMNKTAIYIATAYRRVDIAKNLIGRGADVNSEDLPPYPIDKTTSESPKPLSAAVCNGDLTMVALLVTSGANIDVQLGRRQVTPVHLAAEAGHLDIVKYLLENGANARIEPKYGRSVVEDAATQKIARLLRDHGAK